MRYNQFFKTNNINDFVIAPLPNMCFLRDSVMSLGNGLIISSRKNSLRHRETIFIEYILKYHPMYKDVKVHYGRYEEHSIEGGDVQVMNRETIIIGCSQRTEPESIEKLAKSKTPKHIASAWVSLHIYSFSYAQNIRPIEDIVFILRDQLCRINLNDQLILTIM